MSTVTAPHKDIIDVVFRPDILPAAYRWVNSMQPETVKLFVKVFKRLASDIQKNKDIKKNVEKITLQKSKYTMPEWSLLPIGQTPDAPPPGVDDLLKRPTCTNIAHTEFTQEQRDVARAVPIRTRDSDKSQINATENSPVYLERWARRNLNTTYNADIGKGTLVSSVKENSIRETVKVYSKGVLSEIAMQRAEAYVDKDPVWTRSMRELCRSLISNADSTAYRAGFTIVKKLPTGERFAHPKWSDPKPVLGTTTRAAESFWESEMNRSYVPLKTLEETFKVADQHRARYECPFDFHALTEKNTSTIRADFPDHMASKDEHPLYFDDMKVTIPPGTASVGEIVGKGGVRGY